MGVVDSNSSRVVPLYVLLTLLWMCAGCSKPAPPPPSADAPAPVPVEPTPRVWSDVGAAEVSTLLGYSPVYVYRWEGGAPQGWVQFDGGAEPLRNRLGAPGTPAQLFGSAVPDSELTGMLVVAIRKAGDKGPAGAAEHECAVQVRLGHKGTRIGFPLKGTIRLAGGEAGQMFAASQSGTTIKLQKYPAKAGAGEPVTWLELQVVKTAGSPGS